MASTSKKWFIGCGIGCGLMLLITAGAGISLFMLAKEGIKKGDSIGASYTLVEEAFGSSAEFVPALDGSISPRRVEAFLETRRAMAPEREKLSRILFVLQGEMDGFEKSGASKMELIKAGIGLIPALFDFMESSNRAMVEEGMGPGEYKYIYSLAYFGLLEKDPGDGPAFALTGNEDTDNENTGFRWSFGDDSDDTVTRDDRAKKVRDHLNRHLGLILHNQMEALHQSGASNNDPLVAALAAEISAMDSEKHRLPWEESMPPQIKSSLDLFSDELDELYDPLMNILDVVGKGKD